MSVVAEVTVRVGIEVTRNFSRWVPYDHRLFYCRSNDRGDEKTLPVRDWVSYELAEICECLLDESRKIPLGGSRRYWVQLRVSSIRDYWGEYDSEVVPLKCKPAGRMCR